MDVEFAEYFVSPANYNPPNDYEINGSTQFPNLNSIEFRNLQRDQSVKLLPFYEILETNEDQTTILLATNSYNDRLWNGTVFGYKQFDDIGKPDAEVIKLEFDSNVMGMRFVDKTMVLFTTASGSIQLWSTQCEIRQQNGYNLFQVSKKTEHFGMVTGFTIQSGKKRAVTGSMDGCLKVWTLEPCDIVSENTFRYAHNEVITDISSKPESSDIFATCSRDRFLTIWDLRSRLPLCDTCKNEDFANTACLWSKSNGLNHLYVGDDSGAFHIHDPRKLNERLLTKRLLNRPIYKFQMNPTGKVICILGQTNVLKVIKNDLTADTIYENSDACDYVRDVCWANNGQQQPAHSNFHSVGWNKGFAHHTIKQST